MLLDFIEKKCDTLAHYSKRVNYFIPLSKQDNYRILHTTNYFNVVLRYLTNVAFTNTPVKRFNRCTHVIKNFRVGYAKFAAIKESRAKILVINKIRLTTTMNYIEQHRYVIYILMLYSFKFNNIDLLFDICSMIANTNGWTSPFDEEMLVLFASYILSESLYDDEIFLYIMAICERTVEKYDIIINKECFQKHDNYLTVLKDRGIVNISNAPIIFNKCLSLPAGLICPSIKQLIDWYGIDFVNDNIKKLGLAKLTKNYKYAELCEFLLKLDINMVNASGIPIYFSATRNFIKMDAEFDHRITKLFINKFGIYAKYREENLLENWIKKCDSISTVQFLMRNGMKLKGICRVGPLRALLGKRVMQSTLEGFHDKPYIK